jgi:RND family efflux transporter MFP subunit
VLAVVAAIIAIIVIEQRRPVVDVSPARSALIQEVLTSGHGEVTARRSVTVRSPFPKPTAFDLAVETGAQVKAGDIIARAGVIDPMRLAIENRVVAAEAHMRELEAHSVAADVLAPALEAVLRTRAELQAKGTVVGRTIVTAPFDGVVTDVPIRRAEIVAPLGAIVDLNDISQLHAAVPFGEADAARLSVGMPARVLMPGSEPVSGTVDGMGMVVRSLGDGKGKAVLVQVLLPPEARIRPGTTASAEITMPERTALAIPTTAILRDGDRSYAWVVPKVSPSLEQREVQVGATMGATTEVRGLAPGTVVVTHADSPALRRGLLVNPR